MQVGRIDRHEDDPAWRGSPWEAIEVRWDETGDNSIVSMWELTSPDAPLYRWASEEFNLPCGGIWYSMHNSYAYAISAG